MSSLLLSGLMVFMASTLIPANVALASSAIFNVHDFGAVGDGRHDDQDAIQAAINAAVKAGPDDIVYLPAGQYALRDSNGAGTNYGILINNAKHLTVRGEAGTTLLAPPLEVFFGISRSTDVTVKSMTLKRDPITVTQATVTDIDAGASPSATVTIDPGYADFTSPIIKAAKFFIVFSNPESGTWGDHNAACAWFNPRDQTVCWPPSITGVDHLLGETWRVHLNTKPLRTYLGRQVVIWNFSYASSAFVVRETHDLSVEDVSYFPGGTNGGFNLSRNSGTFIFRHFTVGVEPGSGQLISAIGGAMVFNNHIKLVLDHVSITRVWDDAVNMGANFARIAARPDSRTLVVDSRQANDWVAGDRLAIWNWGLKIERDEARIASVEPGPVPGQTILHVDEDIAPVRTGWLSIRSNGNSDDGIDRVIDLDSAGTVSIQNSAFQSLHARDLLLKTSDSVVSGNLFFDTAMAGILVGPQFSWDEGPNVHDLAIISNRFRNVGGSNVLILNDVPSSGVETKISLRDNQFLHYGKFSYGIMGDSSKPIMVQGNDHITATKNDFDD